MMRAAKSVERAAFGLLLANVVTVGAVLACLILARRASETGDGALVALTNDVTRASQAQAAAERMVAVGRGYLVTHEPALLVHAQAAEAKLVRTLQTISSSAPPGEEQRRLDSLLASARHYREVIATQLSGESAPREPPEVASSLRKHLLPARDALIVELDALANRRLREVEALRSAARARRGRALDAMLVIGAPGALANAILVWLLVGRTRKSTSGPGNARAVMRSPIAGRSPPPHGLPRRTLSVRFRP